MDRYVVAALVVILFAVVSALVFALGIRIGEQKARDEQFGDDDDTTLR